MISLVGFINPFAVCITINKILPYPILITLPSFLKLFSPRFSFFLINFQSTYTFIHFLVRLHPLICPLPNFHFLYFDTIPQLQQKYLALGLAIQAASTMTAVFTRN